METKVKNKTKGISLIVLVITILVLAILAATTSISVKELLEVGKTYIVSGYTDGVSVIFMSNINGASDYSNKKQ